MIRNSDKVIVAADYSSNLYKMSTTDYGKLVRENFTKNYKKTPENSKENINVEAMSFVTKLKLDERVQAYTNESVVTINDHK